MWVSFLFAAVLATVHADADPMAKCSSQGFYYEDTQRCECFQCFSGPSCEEKLADCLIQDLAGSPRMFQEVYWSKVNLTTQTPGWYREPYATCEPDCQLTASGPLAGIQVALEEAITRIHTVVGNVNLDGKTIVYANGATELIMAANWAHKMLKGKATTFAQTPYYMGYPAPSQAGFSGLSFSASTELTAEDEVVEMLAYPNNPDGQLRQPWYNHSRVVHDAVYYWPSMIPESQGAMLDYDVMFFSMSKLSGHAGTRFGWAVCKDLQFALMMQKWIGLNSLHVSVDSSHRAWSLLNHLGEHGLTTFFPAIKKAFAARWQQISAIFGTGDRFTQLSRVGTFYPWVRCNRPADAKNCSGVFRSVGVEVLPGTQFGVSADYVRMELVQYQPVFDMMVARLQQLVQ